MSQTWTDGIRVLALTMLDETIKEELEADGSIDCVDDNIVVGSWDDVIFCEVDNASVDIMVGWIVEFCRISVELMSDAFGKFDEDTIVDNFEQITSVVVII